jgi:hypothetical protein
VLRILWVAEKTFSGFLDLFQANEEIQEFEWQGEK